MPIDVSIESQTNETKTGHQVLAIAYIFAPLVKLLNKNLSAKDVSISALPSCHNHQIQRPNKTAKMAVRSETLPASFNLIHMAFFLSHLLFCQSPGDI